MNALTRVLYALGFALAVVSLGFGIFQQGDQFRLFLALGGFALLAILGFNAVYQIGTAGNIQAKKLETKPLTERPSVKNASLTEQERVIPRYSQLEVEARCAFCHLFIGASMGKVEDNGSQYHVDCYKSYQKNQGIQSL